MFLSTKLFINWWFDVKLTIHCNINYNNRYYYKLSGNN